MDVLKRCGATIIGIQPSQPANAFTNTIGFSLDVPGLKGRISSKLMLKYPKKQIFYNIKPDISVNMKSFRSHRWDVDTTLLETMKLIRAGK